VLVKAIAYSEAKRTVIPTEGGQPFRRKLKDTYNAKPENEWQEKLYNRRVGYAIMLGAIILLMILFGVLGSLANR